MPVHQVHVDAVAACFGGAVLPLTLPPLKLDPFRTFVPGEKALPRAAFGAEMEPRNPVGNKTPPSSLNEIFKFSRPDSILMGGGY